MNRRTGGKEKEKLIQHDDGDNDDGDNDGDYEEEEETFKMAIDMFPEAPFFNCLILNTNFRQPETNNRFHFCFLDI